MITKSESKTLSESKALRAKVLRITKQETNAFLKAVEEIKPGQVWRARPGTTTGGREWKLDSKRGSDLFLVLNKKPKSPADHMTSVDCLFSNGKILELVLSGTFFNQFELAADYSTP